MSSVPCGPGDIHLAGNSTTNLVSPNYPNPFNPNLNCVFFITTQTSSTITLLFNDLWLEGDAYFVSGLTETLNPPQPSLHHYLKETTVAPTYVTYHAQDIFILFGNAIAQVAPKRFSVSIHQDYEQGRELGCVLLRIFYFTYVAFHSETCSTCLALTLCKLYRSRLFNARSRSIQTCAKRPSEVKCNEIKGVILVS